MTNKFARLDAILGADPRRVRLHLGEPDYQGLELEIFRRKDHALALFYRPVGTVPQVSALMLYGEEAQTLYTSGLTPLSLSTYHLVAGRLSSPDKDSGEQMLGEPVTPEWLLQLCGPPAAVEGSGVSTWVYGTQFGVLACFTVLAGQVTSVRLTK